MTGPVRPAMVAAVLGALVAVLVATLAGCTSSGHAGRSAARSTVGASASSTASALSTTLPPGRPIAAASLQSPLLRGVASIRSAHIELAVSVGDATITSSGDETVRDGRLSTIALRSALPANGELEVRLVGGRTYAKLPQSLYRTTRTWVLISAASPSAKIRSLAASIASSLRSASPSSVAQYLSAASSARRIGTARVGSIATTRYGLLVSVQRLPSTFPGRANLIGIGLPTVPVQLYLDAAGRPVRVSETVAVAGQTTAVVATLSRINQPVTVVAPPAPEVGTS